jgi:hypothetical protein
VGFFDRIFVKRAAGNPALGHAVQAYQQSSSVATHRALFRELQNSTLLLLLNQEAKGVKPGALINPHTGASVEFLTSVDRETNGRVLPVFTDEAALKAWTATNRQSSIKFPYVAMRAKDLFPILTRTAIDVCLIATGGTVTLQIETIRTLAKGNLPNPPIGRK